jgi:PAS domain S-box-containing protein
MPKRSSDRSLEPARHQALTRASPFENSTAAWLAAIVESSDDAIIGKTLDSLVRSWNSGAERIFGYTAAEMVGESIRRIIPGELQHEEDEIVDRLARGERVDHFETVRCHKDKSIVDVSLSISPIRDPSGMIVGAAKIARDITEAKRQLRAERQLHEQLQDLTGELEQQVEEGQALTEELEQTNEQLMSTLESAEAARRLANDANATKSTFLAMMSHELRTPLNAITGYVDLLDLGLHGPLEAAQRDALARIKRSANTLLRLIDDVLNFAKLEAGHLDFRYEAVRLDEFAATLGSFIAPRVALKRLNYRLTTAGPDVVVNMDRAKSEQIMLNLLSNAVKFTDHGGIDVVCAVDDEFIRLGVRDTGRGIRSELLSAIFDPFIQGDRSLTRSVEGTGLGLSISRQLARAMGGDIHVESVVGEGSTFTVVLPRVGPLGR